MLVSGIKYLERLKEIERFMNMQRKGFTLAETLITLTLAGFFAAIVMPILLKPSVDKDTQTYRKAIYTVQRALYEFMNGNDYVKAEQKTSGFVKSRYLSNFTNVDVCNYIASQINTKGEVNCNSVGVNGAENFISVDGIAYYNLGGSGNFDLAEGQTIYVRRIGETDNERQNRTHKVGADENGHMRIHVNYRGKVSVKEDWQYEQTMLENFTKLRN